jgi:hypothetical protein
VPHYSSDEALSLKIVRNMLERGSDFALERVYVRGVYMWEASFSYVDTPAPDGMDMGPDSIAMAISRAALKALGVEL